ncbi:hypothetical protein A3J36_03220 [Candidatus Uhrbacteria bacterium RIFCSPLOWO2_02_FULL_54_37]|uniref:PKD domain-containing protein n=1 Tax=Candidatus Uhrbacteria bacterium RIFCSPLOWO2_02_FULL_54_37 TaxID=1802412 RepID=A0A1F7VHA2_9BACT|nr:MAG: hypothetical protein A3J36_03220 [Candidatus Uhrbacteria bacterium RIFCSPLOWO2_02_FULL_54_37]
MTRAPTLTLFVLSCTALLLVAHAADAFTGARNRTYSFQAQAADPEGNALYYTFNWGDTTQTRVPSSGTVASGTQVNSAHLWSAANVYSVYVVACDASLCSLQSDPAVADIQLPSKPGPITSDESSPSWSSDGTFILTWTASNPHSLSSVPVAISQYDVWRQFNGGPINNVGSPSAANYNENNIADGNYVYYVIARDDTTPANLSPQSDSFSLTVNRSGGGTPPTADFDFCTLAADTVQFEDLSDDDADGGTVTGWDWDFGDGSAASSLQHPLHNFTTQQTSAIEGATPLAAAGTASETLVKTAPRRMRARAGSALGSLWQSLRSLFSPPPAAQAQAGWWSGGASWGFRRQITFQNSGNGALANATVLVKLNSGRINYNQVQNQGQDLRFIDADGATALSYEIEQWNESGDSFVWVKVPQISNDNSDFIWMYYGNPSAPSGANPAGAWDSSYAMVLHFTADTQDSTSFNHDATDNGTSATTGVAGGARSCNGSSYLTVGDSSDLRPRTGPFTVEFWFRSTGADDLGSILAKGESAGNYESISFGQCRFNGCSSPGQEFQVYYRNDNDNNEYWRDGDYFDNAWHYVAMPIASSNATLYMDMATLSKDDDRGSPNVDITKNWMMCNDDFNERWPGSVDEVRISATNRPQGWLRASYNSMRDSFNAYGSEEARPPSNQSPSTPSSLSQTPGAEGATTVDNTPSMSFTISDPNAGDTVGYQMQIDDNSNFSSPTIDYTWPGAPTNPNTVTYDVSPALANGTYYWRVRARDGAGLTSSWATDSNGFQGTGADFTVNAVAANFSLNNNGPVTVTQGGAAQNVTLTVTASGGFTTNVDLSHTCASSNLSCSWPSGSSCNPGGSSCTRTLSIGPGTASTGAKTVTVTGTAPGYGNQTTDVGVTVNPPANQSPSTPSSLSQTPGAEGATTVDNTPSMSFTISDPNAGDTVGYQMQIDDNSNFSSPTIDYTWPGAPTNPNTVTYDVSPALANGTYYWRVRARDGAGLTSSWATDSNGFQGTGADFAVNITPGNYSVTLTATDNDGLPSTPRQYAVNLSAAPSCSSLFTLTNVTTTKCNEVGLTWTAARAATSYTIYRSSDGGGSWTPVQANVATLFTYDAVAQNSAYQYYIVAHLPSGTTLSTSTASPACTGTWSGAGPVARCTLPAATGSCAPPITPLPATSACGVITPTWSAQAGALNYRVWRAIGADNFAAAEAAGPLATVPSSQLAYEDRDIVPDVDYYYYVSDEKDPASPSSATHSKSSCFRGSRWQER